MFNRLLFRGLAAVCSLIFLASAAEARNANPLGMRTDRPRHFIDRDCTDIYNVPATTDGTVLTTLTNWDTMAEAVNPDANLDDAVQTSGSADGWCDSEPWKIKGAYTSGASSSVFVGPLIVDGNGFFLTWYFPTIVTSYQFFFGYSPELAPTSFRQLGGSAALTSTIVNLAEILPIHATSASATSSQYTAFDNFFWPSGRPIYLQITTTGAGAFAYDVEIVPIKQPGRLK